MPTATSPTHPHIILYIAEHARQMFGDEQFTPAFQKVARVTLKGPLGLPNCREETSQSERWLPFCW